MSDCDEHALAVKRFIVVMFADGSDALTQPAYQREENGQNTIIG
jgi:hypothetical protein